MALEQCGIATATPSGVKHDEIKRCRVCGPIIRCMRDKLKMRKLAQSELMHDLARLGISVAILLRSLERPKYLESAAREVGINNRVLQRDDQTVTAEQGNKPGSTCG